jgi:hypothetical protein
VCASEVPRELGAGKADDREMAILSALQFSASASSSVGWELFFKSTVGVERDAYCKAWQKSVRHLNKVAYAHCTKSRISRLLQVAMEVMPASQDLVVSAGLANLCGRACGYSVDPHFEELFLHNVKLVDSVLQVWRRVISTSFPEQWWVERSQVMDCTMVTINSLLFFSQGFSMIFRANNAELPKAVEPQWHEIVHRAIDVAKINYSAQLSRHSKMPLAIFLVVRSLAEFSLDPSLQGLMFKSDVVPALLWASANSYPIPGISTAGIAAGVAADLIGRNEDGLTLTREAVTGVLENWLMFFDPSGRRWLYPAHKVLGDATRLANISISDANKAFIIEQKGVFEGLATGLLLEPSNPRREQKGASELQTASARTLQNLALSPVGAGPMRAHAGVMQALRQLAESGMSEEARQCASGALFELDEQARSGMVQASTSVAAVEHIMLSYNWDHQAVIKRVHASLVRRGYTVWIDIERMQGSTVEAMASAVEDAAAMVYGISRAYKESANCRLEAQYAYQREKEMVPLMMEEGYRADGWLGMLLGTRLWYSCCGSVLSSEAAFEGKMEELCRELGDRGKPRPLLHPPTSEKAHICHANVRQEESNDLDAALDAALGFFDGDDLAHLGE